MKYIPLAVFLALPLIVLAQTENIEGESSTLLPRIAITVGVIVAVVIGYVIARRSGKQ